MDAVTAVTPLGQRPHSPVTLVSMPFMDAYRPSIQLGLLKSIAVAHGFPVRTLHANLTFAAKIGVEYYQLLSQHRGRMVGDWLFSADAFRDQAPDNDSRLTVDLAEDLSYLDVSSEKSLEWLTKIRQVDVPEYLDELAGAPEWKETSVVGFSSTFQQNTASFALARRLKEQYPHIFIVFGGANFDGDMGLELVRTLKFIDAAVIGEGDDAFPRLLHALATGSDLDTVPGLARRVGAQVKLAPAIAPPTRLDDLPIPDYDEYFELAENLGILPRSGHRKVWLPIETSRGCWWGAKHHCTFCGLNATTMSFRSKSAQRVLDELTQQARRYRSFSFEAVDNILEMSYLKSLFPALVSSEASYEFFYEVKANLSREQLRLMAQAGVTYIQPGIESLSSNVLRLMRKGVRAAQNINLLRWSQYYGINLSWNLIWGFPGETDSDYAEQIAIMPHLFHLPPPSGANRIWLERFSPLFTGDDASWLLAKTPESSYRYVYPDSFDLDRIAYFFDYRAATDVLEETYNEMRRAVTAWSDAWLTESPPVLKFWRGPHFVQIYDDRHHGQAGTYILEDTLADLYLACCNRPTTATAVRRELDLHLPAGAIQDIFEEFRRRGLMFLDGDLALALAVPAAKSR